MAFPVYSTLLVQGQQLSPPVSRLGYILSPGYVAVLRDIDIFLEAGTAAGNLYLYDQPSSTPFMFWPGPNVFGPTYLYWRGRQVFGPYEEETEAFFFNTDSGGTNTFNIRCSGYLLTTS